MSVDTKAAREAHFHPGISSAGLLGESDPDTRPILTDCQRWKGRLE
jgi:hypothetical protein